jgi:hypothetical protein
MTRPEFGMVSPEPTPMTRPEFGMVSPEPGVRYGVPRTCPPNQAGVRYGVPRTNRKGPVNPTFEMVQRRAIMWGATSCRILHRSAPAITGRLARRATTSAAAHNGPESIWVEDESVRGVRSGKRFSVRPWGSDPVSGFRAFCPTIETETILADMPCDCQRPAG